MMATGCGVVVKFRTVEALLEPLNVMLEEVKLNDDAEGRPLTLSETEFANAPNGFNCTVYCAVWPAATVRLEGLMAMLKLPAMA